MMQSTVFIVICNNIAIFVCHLGADVFLFPNIIQWSHLHRGTNAVKSHFIVYGCRIYRVGLNKQAILIEQFDGRPVYVNIQT